MQEHNLDLINVKYDEEILRKNSHLFDKVDWYWISLHQKLSEKFMMEFIDYINVEQLEKNKKIPLEDKQEIIAYQLLVG